MTLGFKKLSVAVAVAAALGMAAPMVATTTANAVDTPVSAADTQEQTTWNWVDDFTSFDAVSGDNATWHAQWRGQRDIWYDFTKDVKHAEAADGSYRYWYGFGAQDSGPVGFQTIDGVKLGVVSVANNVPNGTDTAITWKAPKDGTVWLTFGQGEPYRSVAGGSITFAVQTVTSSGAASTRKLATLTDTSTPAGWDSPIPLRVEANGYVRILAESSGSFADGRVFASPTITYDAPDSYSFVDEVSQTFQQQTTGTWSVERETAADTWQAVTGRSGSNATYMYNTYYGGGVNKASSSIAGGNQNDFRGILIDQPWDSLSTALTWTAPKAGKVTVGLRNNEPYRLSASKTPSQPLQLKLQKGSEDPICSVSLPAQAYVQSAEFASCVSKNGVIDVAEGDKVRIIATSAQNEDISDLTVSPIVSYVNENTTDGTYSAKVANVTDHRADKTSDANVPDGSLTAPAAPAGYTFAGWYSDADLATALGADVKSGVAYAKFVPVADVIKFQGGSLGLDRFKNEDGTTDYTKTDLRFGYKYALPEGATYNQSASGWRYGVTSADLGSLNLSTKVTSYEVGEDGVLEANLMFLGLRAVNYRRPIYVAAFTGYTTADGTPVVVSETQGNARSVYQVADDVTNDDQAGSELKTFAEGIKNAAPAQE